MIRIVCDTGPLLHLHEADCLALLARAGQVHIPPTVQAELVSHNPGWVSLRPPWVEIVALEPSFVEQALGWWRSGLLDQGEAEALALCAQLSPDWFLTDDTAARMIAKAQSLETHGSLGVVLWAAASGHLDFASAKSAMNRLARSSLWISARVLAEVDAALVQIFERE